MNGRDRFLIALSNGKPDRLPCQVHSFMKYFLAKKLLFYDSLAYKFYGMDPVLYVGPRRIFTEEAKKNWREVVKPRGVKDGVITSDVVIHTPKGDLFKTVAVNKYTAWDTVPLIKTEADFELFREFYPVPSKLDWSRVIKARDKVGDKGIVRTVSPGYGQSGAFQSLATMIGTTELIYKVYDEPDWVHYALKIINDKNIETMVNGGRVEADLVETGGGAGSSTVISPDIHEEFCLPYDKLLHKAIKDMGGKISYHLCGGIMPLLEIVAENGADALETMTPPGMGGDCDFAEASRRIGDKMAFIGGIDQNKCFTGDPQSAVDMVRELFAAKSNGGYICSPSDHFFEAKHKNIRAFADTCKECKY